MAKSIVLKDVQSPERLLDETALFLHRIVTQLPNDFYHFDPIRKTLTGERRGREYRLGDRVEIVVLKASVEDRRIDFRLVEDRGPFVPATPVQRGQPAKRKKQTY